MPETPSRMFSFFKHETYLEKPLILTKKIFNLNFLSFHLRPVSLCSELTRVMSKYRKGFRKPCFEMITRAQIVFNMKIVMEHLRKS